MLMVPYHKLFGRLGNQMFQGAYIYSQMKKGKIDDIYVQDPYYFDEYRDEIRKLYGTGVGQINKVAIHVRRGDYVDNPFYVDLTKTDYYLKGMELFPDDGFIVVSDDIEWCMKQPMFKGCEFYSKSEVDDMNYIASCKGIIMANSSFSWWASYLSNAKVVAPSVANWYSDGVERTICPKEWIRI